MQVQLTGFYAAQGFDERRLTFVVMVARMDGKWVLCRHRARDTWECPGGHIEAGETPLAAAQRELFEETGAVDSVLEPVCVYGAAPGGDMTRESFGMLYRAQITRMGALPPSEIGRVCLMDELPDVWTYPLVQAALVDKAWND